MKKNIVSCSVPMVFLCSSAWAISPGAAGVSGMGVTPGYVRAVPASAQNTAAYFTIENTSETALSLTGAQSDVADSVEFHQLLRNGGKGKLITMEPVASVDVPPHGKVEFKPMGLHVMFVGLKKRFFSEKQVKLTLLFSDGEKRTIELPVRALPVL
jgi:periplasmic copper chaperone A